MKSFIPLKKIIDDILGNVHLIAVVANKCDLYLKEQEIVDVDVAFDNTCNLRCESCRSEYIIDKSIETINIAEKICKKMIPESRRVTVAGNGEVFLSKAYSKIFEGFYPNTCLL